MRLGLSRRARPARAGATLAELLVTLTLLGLVVGPMIVVLARQQRFYRSASDVIDARTHVRQAVEVLPGDLRAISSSDIRNGTDLYVAEDKAIEFRTFIGSSVICRVNSTLKLLLPPRELAAGTNLTSWITKPQAYDSVLIYDDSAVAGRADDHWKAYQITNISNVPAATSAECPVASGFVQDVDIAAGKQSYIITLASPITTGITKGAPIRFFFRRRYELYQPAGSTNWYLGISQCRSSCTALAPISGPYAAYSATPGSSGLRFTYLDSLGAEINPSNTTERARIWRIRLAARADTRGPVDIPGKTGGVLRDSLSLDIALRNRQ